MKIINIFELIKFQTQKVTYFRREQVLCLILIVHVHLVQALSRSNRIHNSIATYLYFTTLLVFSESIEQTTQNILKSYLNVKYGHVFNTKYYNIISYLGELN